MRNGLSNYLADNPVYSTGFLKAAQQQPDETQFAQDFSNLAFQFIQDRAPSLMKYILGFEVVDRADNGTRAVGIFGFKIDGGYYYVPAFFLNGQVKGIDSILSKRTNSFVPLSEEWINYIINRRANELGKEAPPDGRNGGPSEYENPTFDFLQRPTVGPLGGSPYSLGSKMASDQTPWSFTDAWNAIRADIEKRADEDPEFKKAFMGTYLAFSGVRSPLKKEASSPVQDFILKVGGPRAERTLMNALRNVKTANAALEFYEGPAAFHVDKYPNSGRDCYLMRKQAEAVRLTSVRITVTSDPTNDAEAREIIEDGFTIRDDREPERKSDVITTDYEANFQNPDRPGVYNVLVNGGVTKRAYVLDMDRMFHKGAKSSMVVYFPDNKQVITAKSRDIWCEGGAVDGFDTIYDAAIGFKDCELRKDYMFIGNTGTAFPKYHVSNVKRNKGERPVINGSFSYYGDSDWEPDPSDDFTQYWKDDPFHKRDGTLKNLGSTTWISAVELADFTGAPKQSGGTVVMPSDWKALPCGDEFCGDDRCCVPEDGSEEARKRAQKPTYSLASLDSLSLELRKEGAAKLEVRSDDGLEYYMSFDGGHYTRPVGYKQACIDMVTRLGIQCADAKSLLKKAAVEKKAKCLVKMGQFVGVSAEQPREQTPESDPYTGIPVYRSPYYDQTEMPFNNVDRSVSDDNEIGENIGGDIQRQSEGSGEAEFDPEAAQLAQEAGQLGQKDVFDKAAIGGLAKVYDTGAVIDSYLPEFIQAVDRIGRVLFLYYWKHDDFVSRYGTDDVIEMEDMIKNVFRTLGKLTIDLKRKAIGNGDADSDTDMI